MKLTKIHRILKLKQSDWMKIYIDFNTEKKNAANSFEENIFKIMVNSVCDKTLQNLGKIITIRIVNNEKDYLKHTSKPTFISQKVLNKNYAAVHEMKTVLILKKTIHVGFTVRELRK